MKRSAKGKPVAAPNFGALDNPQLASVLKPVELAVLRYARGVLLDAEAFAHAIFRALDTADTLQRQGLEALFPELFSAWQALHSGELHERLAPTGGER